MKWIKPSKIEGKIQAPPSKSMTIRIAAMASLCRGKTLMIHPSCCDDALAGFRIAEALGATLAHDNGSLAIEGGSAARESVLDCGESALCMRMFTPIAALNDSEMILTGTGSLLKRPMRQMEQPLINLGVQCIIKDGVPPVRIQGPLKAGEVKIDGSLSSQFLTGLLTALPRCQGGSEVIASNLKSKPYVRMTLGLLERFGIAVDYSKNLEEFSIPGNQIFRGRSISVEADWSAAAFLLTAGAIAGKVAVSNLSFDSDQADKRIMEALDEAGASTRVSGGTITAEKSNLKAFRFDATECPDLFPPLAVLACFSEGQTEIQGIDRLRHKESDRADALYKELTGIGADMQIDRNTLKIRGTKMAGGTIDSHGDHRIAMAGAITGLCSVQGVAVRNWKCVAKSYPGFFSDLQSIGGRIS